MAYFATVVTPGGPEWALGGLVVLPSTPVTIIHDLTLNFPYVLHTLRAKTGQPLEVDLMLDGKPLCMEVDTGAAVSLVSEKTTGVCFHNVACSPQKPVCVHTQESRSQ